jgi:hypothetical protein
MAADESTAPPDVRFPCAIFDATFHPQQDVIAIGLVSGRAEM